MPFRPEELDPCPNTLFQRSGESFPPEIFHLRKAFRRIELARWPSQFRPEKGLNAAGFSDCSSATGHGVLRESKMHCESTKRDPKGPCKMLFPSPAPIASAGGRSERHHLRLIPERRSRVSNLGDLRRSFENSFPKRCRPLSGGRVRPPGIRRSVHGTRAHRLVSRKAPVGLVDRQRRRGRASMANDPVAPAGRLGALEHAEVWYRSSRSHRTPARIRLPSDPVLLYLRLRRESGTPRRALSSRTRLGPVSQLSTELFSPDRHNRRPDSKTLRLCATH